MVLACGSKSENALYENIKQKFSEVVLVGDAGKPRKVVDAVEEGTRAGLAI